MNKQTQIAAVIVFVILIGWLLIHKKAVSPTSTATIPNTELKDISTPVSTIENSSPKDVVLAKQPPSEIVLSEKDNNKVFTIKKGGTFTINIKERIGGYDSISISYRSSTLELIDHGFVPSTIAGSSGSRIWTFEAIEEEITDITITAIPNKGDSLQVIFSNKVEVAK